MLIAPPVSSAFLPTRVMRCFLGAAALTSALLSAGCSSPAVKTTAAPASAANPAPAETPSDLKPFGKLQKGMRAAEVLALLGPAEEISAAVTEGTKSEVWLYRHLYSGKPKTVAAEMQEVPFFDPVTGAMRMVMEPVMRTEVTRVSETTELLLIKDLLVEWKQSRKNEPPLYY